MEQPLVIIISVKICWIVAYYFLTCNKSVQGTVKISPSGVALVCSGGHLDIACTTNGSFLRWHIRSEIENDAIRTYTRVLSSGIRVSTVAPLMINNTMFSFSRTSPQGTLPLTSRLAVNPVSEILNGTEVKCEDVIVNTNSSTTIINVIRGDVDNVAGHEVDISYSEQFHRDNFTVILNFSYNDEVPLISFTVNISVVQRLSTTVLEGLHRSIALELLYNTDYNISIVASFCGHIIAMNSVKLFYGTCENPLSTYSRGFLTVFGYMIPAREGTNITLHCTSGLELIGPNSSTCMGNGEWEPDPREAECKSPTATAAKNCGVPPSPPPHGHILPYSNTLEGAEVTYACWNIHQEENTSLCTEVNTTAVCNEQGNWEPKSHDLCSIFSGMLTESGSLDVLRAVVSSTVVAFLVISLLIFATGFVCGHYFGQKSKQPSRGTPDHSSASQSIPLYEDVIPSAVEHQEQQLELTENVAYGPAKSMHGHAMMSIK